MVIESDAMRGAGRRLADRAHAHLTAEFLGVPLEQLRDAPLLGGLLIAAASAAGFSLSGVPIVREYPAGVSAVVLLEQGHLSVHALHRPADSAVRRGCAGFARLSQSVGRLIAPPDRARSQDGHPRTGMRTLLAPAHLALTIIILIWDIVLAGRIAQNSQSPRVFQAVSGLAALLVLPGLLLTLATSTIITGRAVATMDWVWPAVLVLFALQATYALVRGWVNPLWGIPIMVYDILIAMIGVVRFMVAHGYDADRAARRAASRRRARRWCSPAARRACSRRRSI